MAELCREIDGLKREYLSSELDPDAVWDELPGLKLSDVSPVARLRERLGEKQQGGETMTPELSLMADGVGRLDKFKGRIVRRSRGDGVTTVSVVGALVDGARLWTDLADAGWPDWFAYLTTYLLDGDIGADDEDAEALTWAYQMAEAIAEPVDYGEARNRFIVRVLSKVEELDGNNVVRPIIALIKRKVDGENVSGELDSMGCYAHEISWSDGDFAEIQVARAAYHAARAVEEKPLFVLHPVDFENVTRAVCSFARAKAYIAKPHNPTTWYVDGFHPVNAKARKFLAEAIPA